MLDEVHLIYLEKVNAVCAQLKRHLLLILNHSTVIKVQYCVAVAKPVSIYIFNYILVCRCMSGVLM